MKTVKEMTIREKIGQLVFFGFPGYELTPEIKALINEYKMGNIIIFTRNIKDTKQLFQLNKEIHQTINQMTGIMPLIAIDQEGGMVTRILEGVTFPPGNMTLAATDLEMAYQVGKIVGTELRALGINMNLAPVLDVNNNPDNPVISVRSFSDNPETVSRFGAHYFRGLQEVGIIATAKHFPGHGDTSQDSHYFLPTINHDKDRLAQIELYPFRQAIKGNIDAIMSAHVIFPAYEDSELPATLSEKVLTGLLREKLGFTGLIVSDCMEMKAIDDHFTAAYGALIGLLAGLDMVFISHTFKKQLETLELLASAVENGKFPLALLDEKVERILKYKNKIYPIIKQYFYDISYHDVVSVLENQQNRQTVSAIVDASLTKVKGKDFYPNRKTLLIATEPFATTVAEEAVSNRSIIDAVRRSGLSFDTVKIGIKIDDSTINEIVDQARYYQNVVVCTYNAGTYLNQAKLVNKLYPVCEDLFVIATRNPYDIFQFPRIDNYLCVYEYTPNSVATIVKYLKREIYPAGRLPVKLKRPFKVGASLYVGLSDYPLTDNLNYLHLLKKYNIEKVFISAHMPEMNQDFEKELHQIVNEANRLGIQVILDVSRPTFYEITLPPIYALRLDYGFRREEIVQLAKNADYCLELNASTLTESDLRYFINRGVDTARLRISHNFYPKPYTGLSHDEILRKNLILKRYGFKVSAFIPSQIGKRPPLYEGLPTIEAHRHLPLEIILSEMANLELEEVFFGDAYAYETELKTAGSFTGELILVPICLYPGLSDNERQILLSEHRNRRDASSHFIRSSVRFSKGVISPRNTIIREYYDVTIDNEQFGRYQGEVSIITDELPSDKRVNVVGNAMVTDFIINEIKKGKKFKFVIIGEVL